MAKGQKFLKVTSILMIIGGALSGITCLLGIAGVALLAAVADSHAAALLLYLALALALAAAVVEFIAGLKGLNASKTGENADKCVILGAVIAGITILSTIINLAGGGKVNVTSILLSLVVPGLYIYGAMQVKKGEWQPQQAQAVPQQPYQQAPQLSADSASAGSAPADFGAPRVPESLFPDPAASAGRAVYRRASAAGPAGTAGADRSPARVLPCLRRQNQRRELLSELRRSPALRSPCPTASGRTHKQRCKKERKSTMKKMLSLVLSLLIVFSLTACGGGDGGSGGGKKDSGLPGIDMKSTEVQTVSADRATLDVLNETFFTYLGGLNYFSDDDEQSKLTYADLKEHIGVDCSDYCYDEAYQRGIYTWYADEDDACSLSLFFGDNGKLIAAGAYNLS